MRPFFILLVFLTHLSLISQESKCLYTVEGIVKDLVTTRPIKEARIEIVSSDNTKREIETIEGKFTFELECSESYWVFAIADTYESAKGRLASWHGEKKSILEFELGKIADCDAYWKKSDSIGKIKLDYFEKNILNVALESKDVTSNNKAFLKAVYGDLNKDKKLRYSKATPTLPLFPIFILEKDNLGIFCNSKYQFTSEKKLIDLTIESKVASSTDYFKDDGMKYFGKLIHYPPLLDSLLKPNEREVFIYTDKRRTTASITSFGIYLDECLDYYHYPLTTENLSKEDKVLFGSNYELDFEYNDYPEIDNQFKIQYAGNCLDCGFQFEPKKTFAKLKGVDNLYFVYADTFPLNNELDFPLRGLYMQIDDGTMVNIWYEDLDLFGCACL